ncbi:hypothetical protein RIF29_26663 [Crotalaria pallida]|uniref:Cation/H+ exchanger domain-containing protein n=1 Tax=Crotalaria pallida TaxID=3830 RepID=A0AAN9EQC4_CROPI
MSFNNNNTLYSDLKTTYNSTLNRTVYTALVTLPANISSDGIWGAENSGRNPLKSYLPVFELQIIVIYVVTLICQFILKHFDFPVLVSQMLAGLILGSLLQQERTLIYKKMLFPYGSHAIIDTIGAIGYAFFMFLTGVEMDISMIKKTGYKPWIIALIGLTAPPAICLQLLKFPQHLDIIIVVLIHTSLSTAVIASLLKELQITNSELGRLALSSVLVSEVVCTIVGSFSTAIRYNDNLIQIVSNMLVLMALCIVMKLVCRPMMFWIIKHTPAGREVKEGYIYLIISMALVLGWITSTVINQNFTLGTFIFGLAVPEGSPLGSALVKKLNFLCTCLLMPIFVTCNVMETNISLGFPTAPTLLLVLYVVFTHLIKIIAYIVPALYYKMPFKDALALALVLNTKGIVEVGMYYILLYKKQIERNTYEILMFSIMIIGCMVKWFVKYLYDSSRKYVSYQKRSIMSLTPHSELRMVVCIHKQSHTLGTKDVLELCCPTLEQPVIVEAIHLIELVGMSNPIFISHRLQRMASGTQTHKSYSDQVVHTFDLYEQENHRGTVKIETYTAISPPCQMHEDVCQLAFDKDASIIILQFHQRWFANGGCEYDDKNIRSLNSKVLQIAPCSIGILVSRSTFNSDSNIRLAMVFVGGKDDREAFFLAKRATRNQRINLVVYHLVPTGHMPDMEDMIDNEALADIKEHSSLGNVSYKKIIANDGPDTSSFLRDIVNAHDFFIVGRRHGIISPQTQGLEDWSEFYELGVIGDLLASADFESRASILVVQQQVKDE